MEFAEQDSYRGYASYRPLSNYTVGVLVYPQPDRSDKGCNASFLRSAMLIIYCAYVIFVLVTAMTMKLSVFPLVMMTMNFQLIQMTGVMRLLWPTCLQNFLQQFAFINFEQDMFQNIIGHGNPINQTEVSTFFTLANVKNSVFLYNSLDVLFFLAILMSLIPFLSFLSRYIKVPFL